MAFPTIPDRETKRKQHYVLKKSTQVFGQIQSFTIDENINTSEENRISDTTRFQTREDKTSNVNFVVYMQDDMKEAAALLGFTLNEGTGWVGTEEIKLDPDSAAMDLTVEKYDNTSGSAVLQGVWTIDNWNPTSWNMPVGGSNTASITATINGVAEDAYYVPTAGIGSTSA